MSIRSNEPVYVVWFKRDLRIADHAALAAACGAATKTNGSVLCVYVIEPSLWRSTDASERQFLFLRESLRDLYKALKSIGLTLHVVTGEVVDILVSIHASIGFVAIHSHEETGNNLTYQRDIAVGAWCQLNEIAWSEYPQFGVVRRLKTRDEWSRHRNALMCAPLIPSPAHVRDAAWPWDAQRWPKAEVLGMSADSPAQRQTGGRTVGLQTLVSFLLERSSTYRGGISSPLSASTACSRLSPYLAFGCLSMREVIAATADRAQAADVGSWQRKGLAAFVSRLHWHCHFIQKLEDEPSIEWQNMHRGYDDLRESDWSDERFARLTSATTGWPLVDACVVMLRETGWLNFRMRAMLVSVAAYPLWLHWKRVGDWLATQFVDYEPGIHWSQVQMQSGTTGINTLRVYNPIKQAKDHDPTGAFVRHWLPALRKLPDEWIFEPWKLPANLQTEYGFKVDDCDATSEVFDWPMPVVDLDAATKAAKAAMYGRRSESAVRTEKTRVLKKHGSRKIPQHKKATDLQSTLDL